MSSYADAEALAALHVELAAKEAAVSGGGGAGNRLLLCDPAERVPGHGVDD